MLLIIVLVILVLLLFGGGGYRYSAGRTGGYAPYDIVFLLIFGVVIWVLLRLAGVV